MSLFNFVESFNTMAFTVNENSKQNHRFGSDAQLIVDTIVAQLKQNDSMFQDYLGQLQKSACFVSQIEMDMPLSFEIFLPLRLPFALITTFNENERSVKFSKRKTSHPFFFANVVNAKCMNILLQRDLEQAIGQMANGIAGKWGDHYDIKYSALSYTRTPFAHQVFAQQRGGINRAIYFDFILALEFDGAEMPLPAYYQAPIGYKWLAYGLVPIGHNYNSANWGVLLPMWQTADLAVRLRSHNMLLLLYRMLYVQRCYCFAVPFMIKFCFFMTTVDRGEKYKNMSVAQLFITTFGHQVFRNFCQLIVASTEGNPSDNIEKTAALREQQVRCKGIFAMLAKGLQLNMISSDFVYKFFYINFNMTNVTVEQKQQQEQQEQKLQWTQEPQLQEPQHQQQQQELVKEEKKQQAEPVKLMEKHEKEKLEPKKKQNLMEATSSRKRRRSI